MPFVPPAGGASGCVTKKRRSYKLIRGEHDVVIAGKRELGLRQGGRRAGERTALSMRPLERTAVMRPSRP
ncbi:hypothetical protein GW17_00011434 [Ensete ventricosum]|uniref:Uncharacterized protein n=1 Tax=Ensete ventricosum TaxID=4639 RepID=A0A444FNV8_ENSVE|nr:hypothetical protein GW17_00011434 [Ensete ventricosum]RZR74949.1 hypothetical protein BHM03_00046573 [Ensete ventricosum]